MKALKKELTEKGIKYTYASKRKTGDYNYTGNIIEKNFPILKANYFQWKNKNLFNPDLTPLELILLQILYSFRVGAKVEVSTIARKTGWDERTITNAMQVLIDNFYIKIEDQKLIILRLSSQDVVIEMVNAGYHLKKVT